MSNRTESGITRTDLITGGFTIPAGTPVEIVPEDNWSAWRPRYQVVDPTNRRTRALPMSQVVLLVEIHDPS